MSVGMDSRRFADAPPPVSKMALAGLFVSVVACLLSFSIWMSTKSTRGTDADDQKTQATNHDNPAQEERQEVTEPTEARAPADTPTSAPAAVPAEPALAREPTTRYGRGVFGDQEAVGAVEGSPMQSQQTVRSNPRRESNSAPASEPKKSRSPANSQTPAKKPKSSERGSSSQFDLFGGRD
jgi:hypothetical protein